MATGTKRVNETMGDKDFEVIRLHPGQGLAMPADNFMGEIKPTVLWILPHGTVTNKPSFVFEMRGLRGEVFVAQISHAMLVEGLKAAGEMAVLSEQ